MKDKQSQIIEEMKRYQIENKLSQRDFAGLIGCSQSAVSQWMNGKRNRSTAYYINFQKLLTNK